ncbi:hypothetical protein CYL21_1113 [Plasmodium falciparum NF54]|uniref:Plasmodium RESA N-terminal domain-containing protein n=2 Tax=Plasmodium falciparum TaxID=5833 RepID=C0H591_PLAF7|nr:Plasmodium exported protein, unknown function [Plasmodium falciparum 3D7]KAF4330740.1 hypothetical protein CYL21_1113 [Plasmodium falciparum NF54]PKC44994.1 hypothetical protein CK202_3984 [Plasmodium falciparum NF54]CAX64269.1 Plasmodium exported protein, unknown function [Plasmodium falciparum 3D7]SOS78591.1 Plasmodium exported protein, unknown function [Plasmodium sp. gorilla clade G1]|eukprot:XP_002808988.1 Plasmodium exported protein, unknown function [Plasmodium falciparum 3D7]
MIFCKDNKKKGSNKKFNVNRVVEDDICLTKNEKIRKGKLCFEMNLLRFLLNKTSFVILLFLYIFFVQRFHILTETGGKESNINRERETYNHQEDHTNLRNLAERIDQPLQEHLENSKEGDEHGFRMLLQNMNPEFSHDEDENHVNNKSGEEINDDILRALKILKGVEKTWYEKCLKERIRYWEVKRGFWNDIEDITWNDLFFGPLTRDMDIEWKKNIWNIWMDNVYKQMWKEDIKDAKHFKTRIKRAYTYQEIKNRFHQKEKGLNEKKANIINQWNIFITKCVEEWKKEKTRRTKRQIPLCLQQIKGNGYPI